MLMQTMTRPLVSTVFAGLIGLGLAVSAAAQTAEAPAEGTTPDAPVEVPAEGAPATDAPVADAPTNDGLSMGAEIEAADGIGSVYTEASFDAWEQRCVRTEDGANPCQLYQLLKDTEGNSVAEINMFSLPAGGEAAAGATIIVPLETLLTANLLMQIDGGKAKIYPYTFCTQIGCVARVGFTAAEVEQFKKGNKAVLTLVPAVDPESKVSIDLSLKGFTKAMESVDAANK